MIKYIAKRLLQAIPVLWIIITITFFMVRLAPGDPFTDEKQMNELVREQIIAYYGLDDPLHIQYFRYLGNVLKGDLGPALKNSSFTVNELIAKSFPISLQLGANAMLIAILIGIPIGIIAAINKNKTADHLPMALAMGGICLPSYVLGPLLILLFAHTLKWFNPSGWYHPSDVVLPALTLGLYYAAYYARLTRASMLETLNQNFITTARAKGVAEWKVLSKHALRIAILPAINFSGPAFAGMISGSFIIETIFNIPGLGRFFVESALNRDKFLILGTVIFYATIILFFNLLVDVIQAYLHPKSRHEK